MSSGVRGNRLEQAMESCVFQLCPVKNMSHLHKPQNPSVKGHSARKPASAAKRLLRPRNAVLAASHHDRPTVSALRCRRKFLSIFPGGFRDEDFIGLERDYKWMAHRHWQEQLNPEVFRRLMEDKAWCEIANRAVRVESRTNLIFSYEKMALRDAVKLDDGARLFSQGLYAFLHEPGDPVAKFEAWVAAVATLPRRLNRVLTWPVATVFGFLAQPKDHIFIKPTVMKMAARKYGWDFAYTPRPSGEAYGNALAWAARVKRDLKDLRPRDMIDVQSFLWVQGSEEY
jgi:hypothetical protein